MQFHSPASFSFGLDNVNVIMSVTFVAYKQMLFISNLFKICEVWLTYSFAVKTRIYSTFTPIHQNNTLLDTTEKNSKQQMKSNDKQQ